MSVTLQYRHTVERSPASDNTAIPPPTTMRSPPAPTGQQDHPSAAAGSFSTPLPAAPRWLLVGNSFGRHSNQMVVVAAAMALAKATDRVLILPDLYFGGGNGGGGSMSAPVDAVYRLTPNRRHRFSTGTDSSPSHVEGLCVDEGMCVVSPAALREADDHPALLSAVSALGCIEMRGVSNRPVLPPTLGNKWHASCRVTRSVTHKKVLAEVLSSIREMEHHQAVYVPLVMYVAQHLEPDTTKAWRLFSPASSVLAAVIRGLHQATPLLHSHGVATANRSGGVVLPAVLGAHVRSLEGSCASRVQQVIRDDMAKQSGGARKELFTDGLRATSAKEASEALLLQCHISAEYLGRFVLSLPTDERSRRDTHDEGGGDPWVFLADDGQQPSLVAALQSHGVRGVRVVRPGDIDAVRSAPAAGQPRALVPLSSLALSPRLRRMLGVVSSEPLFSPGGRDDGFLPGLASRERAAALAFQRDFWMLAVSERFVGAQVSTVAVNVCRRRRAVGQTCDNFVRRDW